jgi:hypothetical protein
MTEVDARAVVTSDIRCLSCDWAVWLGCHLIRLDLRGRKGRFAANEKIVSVQKRRLIRPPAICAMHVRKSGLRMVGARENAAVMPVCVAGTGWR